LACFTIIVVPFGFFSFQKTKYLQFFTMGTRNTALFMMIILGFIFIGQGNGALPDQLPLVNWAGLPKMFGVAVYAFMCHHSLPSIVTPIKDKSFVGKLMGIDLLLIYLTYILLNYSAMFAFGAIENQTCDSTPGPACKIQPLYTWNFNSYHIVPIAKFLGLFPVFTLSTNFPLIMITLRNNVMNLIKLGERSMNPTLRGVIFSIIVTAPAITIAFFTRDIKVLVSLTGSYAGMGIMFLFPSLLVFFARRVVTARFGYYQNKHESFFRHTFWIVLIWVWVVVATSLVVYTQISSVVSE
jgi:amino acid permease